jgi:RimJ/RimL family protein N-acetyltransferase
MARRRVRMSLRLAPLEAFGQWTSREITEPDVEPLGRLMLDAYRDTIDYEGETLDDAVAEVRQTLEGRYGAAMRACSRLIEEDGCPVAACIIVRSDETGTPLLAFSMTAPEFQGQGLQAFLLGESINRLLGEGYRELHLVVTEGNAPARHLYDKLGFRELG